MRKAGPTGGALLLLGVLCAFGSGAALAADRFASTSGSDAANDCLTSASPCLTIGHALTQAVSGDVIKVTADRFFESVWVADSTTLTLSGGWSPDFASQNPAAYSTLVYPYSSLISVFASINDVIDLTVERFVLSNASGVVADVRDNASVTVRFQDCVAKRNRYGMFAGISSGTSTLNIVLANWHAVANRSSLLLVASDASVLTATMDDVTIERVPLIKLSNTPALSVNARDSATLTLVGSGVNVAKNANRAISIGSTGTASCSVTLTNARVLSNRNGGIDADGSGTSLSLTNSVIARNRRRDTTGTSGLWLLDGTYSVVNSTIRGNRSVCCAGGLITNAMVGVSNAIVWDNESASGPANLEIDLGSNVDMDHSDIGPGVSGSYNDLGGNISADPIFLGIREDHVQPTSPAIDAGTCMGAPATDLDGDPRPTGTGCDMGADEFVP